MTRPKAAPAYGVGDEVVLGLPCIIGKHGIESCLLLPRNAVEQHLLEVSAAKLNHAYQLLSESEQQEPTFKPQLIAG